MTSEQKQYQRDLSELAELCAHMVQEYGFTDDDFARLTHGWVTDSRGLPIIIEPKTAFLMLATVARAIKFEIVTKPPKIIM